MEDYFALLNSLGLNRQGKISQIRYFPRFDYQIRPQRHGSGNTTRGDGDLGLLPEGLLGSEAGACCVTVTDVLVKEIEKVPKVALNAYLFKPNRPNRAK